MDATILRKQAEEYLAYLPQGPVWQSEDMHNLFLAMALEIKALREFADRLFLETLPVFTSSCLMLHETDWGLPNPCITEPQTANDRYNALVSKVRSSRGQRPQDYVNLATELGFTNVSVIESTTDAYHWSLEVGEVNDFYFIMNRSYLSNTPLGYRTTNNELNCYLPLTAPSHTVYTIT